MELKKIFGGIALAALVAACSSDDIAPMTPDTPQTGKLTIRTTLPSTRVGLSEQGEATNPGLKVQWKADDKLAVNCYQQNSVSTFTAGTISSDGHNAEFTGTLASVPTEKTTLFAVNQIAAAPIADATAKLDLTTQTGKIEDLGNYDLLSAKGEYVPTNNGKIDLSMKHNVGFIRGTIILPFTPTTETYAVKLKADGLATGVWFSLKDGSESNQSTGDINISAAKVDGNKLTFYAAVLPQTLKNMRADIVGPSAEAYNDLFITDNFQVEAGKLYTVTRSNEKLADVSLWTDNKAWSKTYDVAKYKITTIERIPAEGSDWLSVTSDGTQVVVSATANTTGAPRQAKLIFGNGSQKTTIDLTQIEETDFAGVWDMTAFKTFYTKGSASTTNYDSKWSAAGTTPSDNRTDLKIVDGVNYNNKTELNLVNKTGKTVTAYESLNQNSQKATNNVSITGLFENLKTEALTKVDHSAKQATVGIFIDTHTSTKAQRLYTGQYAGEYAALMPELSTKINGGWSFQYATIGGVQYTWYVGTVSVVGHTTTVRWNANTSGMHKLKTSTSAPKLYICGLQVMRYYNNSISSTSMIRQKPGGYSASNFAAYAVTYQGDIVIKRTASGYKDVEIGGGNN